MSFIAGYCDQISVQPGKTLQFMVSAHGANQADVQIVRLIHGDENPIGPGFIEREVDSGQIGSIDVEEQFTQAGSFVEIADPAGRFDPTESFTLHAFIWPTIPTKGEQAIISKCDIEQRLGVALMINASGCVTLRLGDGERFHDYATDTALATKVWYFVAATYDPKHGMVTVRHEPVINGYNSLLGPIVPGVDAAHSEQPTSVVSGSLKADLLLAGYRTNEQAIAGLYNGKIDRCGIHQRVMSDAELKLIGDGAMPPPDGLLTYWDTTAGYTAQGIGDQVIDRGPHGLHGVGRNRPVRAMTGYNWRGRDDCFRLDPEQFGGIYFHDDAIIDCRWPPAFEWTVPDDLKSGVYAARLRAGDLEDHITFFVRPKKPTAKIAMLMPTASYLAYANEHFVLDSPAVEALTAHPLILSRDDYLLNEHPEWGRSSYDHHSDGYGVCYTSYKRPVMELRPRHRMASTGVTWQFPADLSIIWWLEQMPYDYDVITDEDLHREGVACLSPYTVVINGTHSEYYSEQMMDATEAYVTAGGNLMYLGANGYYWVVAFRDDDPSCMEIRKLDSGSRAWQAAPGEHYMATTGDKGGIWRNRGRPPQKLTGVGFTSEGMDESKPYRRMPDSYDDAVAWIFNGVDNEVFGDFGLALDGAAGIELDRYDLTWGTPPGTWLLASSEGHSDNYPHVGEEIMFNLPGTGGTQDFQIRADMTFVETKNNGAVFSTGSIAWGQALPVNNGDNDVARITANVLKKFVEG